MNVTDFMEKRPQGIVALQHRDLEQSFWVM
jgi:hypothetical protein